jgi:hypothetical protein
VFGNYSVGRVKVNREEIMKEARDVLEEEMADMRRRIKSEERRKKMYVDEAADAVKYIEWATDRIKLLKAAIVKLKT